MHRLWFILIIPLVLIFSQSTEAQTILSDPRSRVNGNIQGPTLKVQNYPQRITVPIPTQNEKPKKIKPPTGTKLIIPKPVEEADK